MTADEAARYHHPQIEALRDGGADMVSAITMTYAEEAVGIALAARTCDVPVALSFTVESDGRLPSGQDLKAAIEETDAATDNTPAYYMINCAHPRITSGERSLPASPGSTASWGSGPTHPGKAMPNLMPRLSSTSAIRRS